MATGLQRDLMLRHVRLFLPIAEEPSRSFGYPRCERGWQDILVRLCQRIEIALAEPEEFEFIRIKQKFGILRVDWDTEAPEDTELKIGHAIDLAVAHSACTCESCGAEGRLYDNNGWLGSRCVEHAAGAIRWRLGMDRPRRTCAGCADGVARPASTTRCTTAWPTR
ncbi:hypothetical protein ACVW1A_008241 [Bradyrhizobium sp. LB1.3]|uniref:hypothetical protein n=1 Tax=unclassified Bradyrhizobium TaxID=2631580 RepID=UPI0033966AC0